jgi:amino acid transporter
VERTLPLAIVITLLLTALIYILLAMAAVLTVPPQELGMSKAPLALVYERSTGAPATAISVIALLAIINGALIQIIMASRVIYGLSCQGALPRLFSFIHPRTRTPLAATALIAAVVMVFALWLPLAQLAEVTSLITLTVFSLVNLALWSLKSRSDQVEGAVWSAPSWVPQVGFIVSAGMLLYGLIHLIRH